jgi:hypothetical protein
METLQSACLQLLLSTQSHPVGFAALPPPSQVLGAQVLGAQEQQLLELYDKLHRVTLERRTLEAELADGTLPVPPSPSPRVTTAEGKQTEQNRKRQKKISSKHAPPASLSMS